MNVVSENNTMTNHPYILFNKSPEQLCRLGARGGKAHGRNHRARRALAPTSPPNPPQQATPRETTAAAITLLDARFLWLRGAEKRASRNQPAGVADNSRRLKHC